jgi:hypothetical protein
MHRKESIMFRRRVSVLVWMLAVVAIASAPALAQVQTGSILVKSLDDQGAVVPGVTVTISSPVLVSATMTGVTDELGTYRFPSLPPGTYTVKVELQGFQTVSREGIVVSVGNTTPVDLTMKVGNMSETVTVAAESPTIDTTSANVNVHLDAKLLETTPSGRDIWSIIEYKVPGLVMDTPDVGGNQGGLQRGITARGTGNGQNTQMLNGVNVGDPAAIGFAGYYYDPSSFQDIQVSSGANDITVPTGGVFINMVTKSGTNRFTGQVLDTYQGKSTQWDNIDSDLQQAGLRPNASAVDYIKNFNVNSGGPILKNKLFYFAALNDQRTAVHFAGFPSPAWTGAPEPDTTNITSIFADPTYQLSTNHRLQATVSRQVYDKINRGADGSNGTQDPQSVWHEHDILAVYQGLWNWVVSDRMFADTRVSYNSINFPLNLKTDFQTLLDQSTNIRTRANTIQQIMDRRRLEISSNWQYYIPQALGGRHEIRAGFDNTYTPEDVDLAINDDVRDTYRTQPSSTGAPPGPVSVQLFNTPLHQKRAVMITSLYAQDSYSYKRITASGAFRWERVEGWLPAQVDPASQYFPEGTVINSGFGTYTLVRNLPEVRDVPLWHNTGPRASFIYDVFGNGKTAVKASIARYYDQIGTGTPGGVNPNGLVSQTFVWNDTGDLVFQPSELGAPNGAISAPLSADLLKQHFLLTKRPYRNEFTAGVDHQLIPDLRLSVTYIQRAEHDQIVTLEQNIPFDYYTPVNFPDPGPDGVTGTADDTTLTVFSENLPTVPSLTGPANDDRGNQQYHGVEFTASKRYSNRWQLLGGYTYSRTTLNGTTTITSPNSFININGRSSIDRAHNFKLTGSYMLPYEILVSGNLRATSGQPYTRTISVTGLPQNVNGFNVNAQPRGSYEFPWIRTVDTRVGKIFRFGVHEFEADMDVYNLFNSNAVFNVRTTTGTVNVTDFTNNTTVRIAQFNSPIGVLGPRIIRFNVSYKFGQ